MDRPDAIAWGLATLFWAAALAVLLALAAREHRRWSGPTPAWGRWLAPRVAAGLGLWALAVVGARWIERAVDAPARPAHAPHRASR